MNCFLDTEFHEYGNQIDLISIGILKANGETLYLVNKDFNIGKAWKNDWLRKNVLRIIFDEALQGMDYDFTLQNFKLLIEGGAHSLSDIKEAVANFLHEPNIKLHGWYSAYDFVILCFLFGGLMKLPKNFPRYMIDLKPIVGNQEIPHFKNTKKHHALEDAKWNQKVFEWCMSPVGDTYG